MNENKKKMQYCSSCATPLVWRIPPDDTHHRHVCSQCGMIHYANPKIIVGTLPAWQNDQVLLCRRAIEPRSGFWTLPAGFMENGESTYEGAIRETLEEANARVKILYLHTVYDIPHIGQVYLLFLAQLQDLKFSPGAETLETRLFRREDINWDHVAFHAVKYCLQQFFADAAEEAGPRSNKLPHCGCYVKKPNVQ